MNEKTVDKYHFCTTDLIGRGAFGSVYRGIDTKLNKVVAIKMLQKGMIQRDAYMMEGLKREISVMQKLRGNNVVRLLDMLESTNNYYIIQEYCKDGDLEGYLQRQQYLTEVGAIRILCDILNGFIELLQQGIIHRDLKPANILVHQNVFKLGDFGFAKQILNFQREIMESKVGTPLYMAPQILMQQSYTSKSDIWSIGCIFYQCIFRRTPWMANSIPDLINQILKYPIQFPSYISPEAKDFIQQCLKINEEERIDWNNLYRHPLIYNKFKDYVDSVKNLEDKAEFILNDLRHHIQLNKIDLMSTFQRLKISNNQFLSFKELQQLLNEINPKLSRQEIEFIFNMIDIDKNNMIDFLEFQKCLQQHRVRISLDFKVDQQVDVVYQDSPVDNQQSQAKKLLLQIKKKIDDQELSLVKLFKQYDLDCNNILDLLEFARFLRYFIPEMANQDITLIYQIFDKNQNGAIDYKEFRQTLEDFGG